MNDNKLAQLLLDKIDMYIALEYTNDEVLNEVVKDLKMVLDEDKYNESFATNKINDMF